MSVSETEMGIALLSVPRSAPISLNRISLRLVYAIML